MAIDYKQFSDKGPPKADDASEKEWWLIPKSREYQLPSVIGGIVRHIKERTARIETQRQVAARLYGNLQLQGLQGVGASRSAATSPNLSDRSQAGARRVSTTAVGRPAPSVSSTRTRSLAGEATATAVIGATRFWVR